MWSFLFGFSFLLLLPVTVIGAIVAAVRRKPTWKKWLAWVGVAFVLMIIGAVKMPPSSAPASSHNEKTDFKQTFAWETADVTEETIRTVFKQTKSVHLPKNATSIQVVDNALKPGHKDVAIFYDPGRFVKESSLVFDVGSTFIRTCEILYKNPKVEKVSINAVSTMIDQYGKSSTGVIIRLVFTRETINNIDWKGLSDRHVIDPGNIYRISDFYYIHPSILKNVNPDEVQL